MVTACMVAPSICRDTDACSTFGVSWRQYDSLPNIWWSHKLSPTTEHAGKYEETTRGVAQFLAGEGVGGCEMHRRLKTVYASVVKWRKRFLESQYGEDDIAAVSVGNAGTSTVKPKVSPYDFLVLDL
ncbi:hypothetical protein TNCV_3275221 [Trichonephila clavipes]|nr:hypothetical protein TNCV_3275221 [Trichonephila clavipes]